MIQHCAASGEQFEITEKDLAFYQRVSPTFNKTKHPIPPPTLCPKERARRRQSWRNERRFCKRNCDLCKRGIVSLYPTDVPFPVYCNTCWYGDGWDPKDFGRDFDFSKTFTEQFVELQNAVPRIALIQLAEMDNSEYTHDVIRLKDCYLVFDGEQARNACYGETFYRVTDCYDFLELMNSELCYECIGCDQCYELRFSHNCFQCSDSWFLRDCRGCKNCFACCNLHQKQYHIFNKPHSKEQYQTFIDALQSSDPESLAEAKQKAMDFWQTQPVRYMRGVQNENVSGNYVSFSKDSQHCFNCKQLRDCKYCTNVQLTANDCYDIDVWGNGLDLCAESTCVGETGRDIFGCLYVCFGAEQVYYSHHCSRQVKNLFGCIGLRKSMNFIFNKSYAAEDYQAMASRIADHMKETKEWGEFLPITASPFAYNETVAHEYYPVSQQEVQANGWRWAEEIDKAPGAAKQHSAAEPIDDLLKITFSCAESGRAFKLQRAEIEFYRNAKLPLPRFHPDVRHVKRMKARNPRELRPHQCSGCKTEFVTSYTAETRADILCESCYQNIIQ